MEFVMYTQFSNKLDQLGPEGAAEYARSLGFIAAELIASTEGIGYDNVPDTKTAKKFRKVWKERNFPIACYSVYTNLWKNKANEEALMRKVEVAAELECPYLHHTLFPKYHPGPDDPSYADSRAMILDAAARVADYADQYGVTCLYENQGAYFNSVEGYGSFWVELRQHCRNVGICADLGNVLFVNETPQDFLKKFVADVRHVHLKDYLRKTAERTPGLYWCRAKNDVWLRDTMIGSGIVDFDACLKLLKDAGYTGFYALENCHPEPFEDGVRQAMEYLRR